MGGFGRNRHLLELNSVQPVKSRGAHNVWMLDALVQLLLQKLVSLTNPLVDVWFGGDAILDFIHYRYL